MKAINLNLRGLRRLILLFSLTVANFANAGGVRGGGGNASDDSPVSALTVQTAIPETVLMLKPHFLGLMWTLDLTKASGRDESAHYYYQMLTRLKGTPDDNIIKRVSNLRIIPQAECFDPDGQPADASVLNAELNQICFASERFAKKVVQSNYQMKLFGLLAHEASHLMGIEEQYARTTIQPNAESDFASAKILYGKRFEFIEHLKRINEENLNRALRLLSSGASPNRICSIGLQTIALDMIGIMNGTIFQNGSSSTLLPSREITSFMANFLRLAVAHITYCLQDDEIVDEIKDASGWKSMTPAKLRASVKVTEFWEKQGEGTSFPMADQIIYGVNYHDTKALSPIIAGVQKDLTHILLTLVSLYGDLPPGRSK